MHKAREAILVLKPVTFRYKPEIDPEKVPQFGLVAEQVEKVNPDLVVHDHNRKPPHCSLRSGNAMLLNEFHESLINRRMESEFLTMLKSRNRLVLTFLDQDIFCRFARTSATFTHFSAAVIG